MPFAECVFPKQYLQRSSAEAIYACRTGLLGREYTEIGTSISNLVTWSIPRYVVKERVLRGVSSGQFPVIRDSYKQTRGQDNYRPVPFKHLHTIAYQGMCVAMKKHGTWYDTGQILRPLISARQSLPPWRIFITEEIYVYIRSSFCSDRPNNKLECYKPNFII